MGDAEVRRVAATYDEPHRAQGLVVPYLHAIEGDRVCWFNMALNRATTTRPAVPTTSAE
jgi:hypothetical protein